MKDINMMALEMWTFIDTHDINKLGIDETEHQLDLIQNKYIKE